MTKVALSLEPEEVGRSPIGETIDVLATCVEESDGSHLRSGPVYFVRKDVRAAVSRLEALPFDPAETDPV